jgi:hypothetical protein
MTHRAAINQPFAIMYGQVHVNGSGITRSMVSSIAFKVVDQSDKSVYTTGTLDKEQCVFDEPQTDGRWVEDEIGYDVRHDVSGTLLQDIGSYCFVHTITLTDGTQFPLKWWVDVFDETDETTI